MNAVDKFDVKRFLYLKNIYDSFLMTEELKYYVNEIESNASINKETKVSFAYFDFELLINKIETNKIKSDDCSEFYWALENFYSTNLDKIKKFDCKHFFYNTIFATLDENLDSIYDYEMFKLFSCNGKDNHSPMMVNEYVNEKGCYVIEFASAFYGHIFDLVILEMPIINFFTNFKEIIS